MLDAEKQCDKHGALGKEFRWGWWTSIGGSGGKALLHRALKAQQSMQFARHVSGFDMHNLRHGSRPSPLVSKLLLIVVYFHNVFRAPPMYFGHCYFGHGSIKRGCKRVWAQQPIAFQHALHF
jgi:hypothetical protein